MAYGITSGGFIIPTLQEILDEKAEEYQNIFGKDFRLDNDNIIWQLAQIESEREYRTWQNAEMVYNSQTLNAAEGIYLDDVLGLRGFFRNGSRAGDGYAVIESNNSIINSTVIPTTTNFNGNNGIIYKTTVDTALTDRTNGILLTYEDFTGVVNYDFTYQATQNGNSISVSQEVDGGDNTSVTTYFEAIRASIILNTANVDTVDVDVIDPNTDDVTLRLGYSASLELVGVSDITNFKIEPIVGTKANSVFVQASSTGFNPLGIGGISSSSPSSAGYLQVTNLEAFNAGNDVESDAVYRIRANSIPQQAAFGSKDYIIQQVSAVEGVTSVIVNANPTSVAVSGVSPFSFETIVVGGVSQDIGEAIYRSKCITDNTHGDVQVIVVTADGTTETVNFTRGTTVTLALRLRYSTTNGVPLSSTEQSTIQDNLKDFADSFETGKNVFNAQLQSIIFSSLNINRLTDLDLKIWDSADSEPDDTTFGDNFTPESNELPIFDFGAVGITYEQV